MLKLYCFFSFLALSFSGFCQSSDIHKTYTAADLESKPQAQKGTYQFQIWNQKMRYYFTTETFILIEELRQYNSDTTVKLNPMTDVFIPSRKKINAPDFKPLPEFHYK